MLSKPFHLLGLLFAIAVTGMCYYVWTLIPGLIRGTIFNDFRIVAGMLAVILVLSLAELIANAAMKALCPK